MKETIRKSVCEAADAAKRLLEPEAIQFIEDVASAIITCYQSGGKVIIAGNGGSLCDSMHFAEELTGFYREKRAALPAIALADPGHITCVGNDVGFDEIFSRGVEAHGKPNDVFIALTTSGNSKNLVRAVAVAKEMGLKTVCFLGKTGGHLKGSAHFEWIVEGFTYSDRIQEVHMAAIHIVIEQVEAALFAYATS